MCLDLAPARIIRYVGESCQRLTMTAPIPDLNPPPRILMGPGPVDADPRVLRAMSMPLLGQFDPAFTAYMNETMELYRRVYQTKNRWTFLVDGTARAGIEVLLVSLIAPGDAVLVPIFGRFGHLLCEIARRAGAVVHTVEDRKSTRLNSSHVEISYAVFCLKKKKKKLNRIQSIKTKKKNKTNK